MTSSEMSPHGFRITTYEPDLPPDEMLKHKQEIMNNFIKRINQLPTNS